MYYNAEKTAEAICNIENSFTSYNEKKEALSVSLKKFVDNNSFKGEIANFSKEFVDSFELKILDSQIELHNNLLNMYIHSLESFAEQVDPHQNAKLDTAILESINNDLKSIFYDMYSYCTDFDCIADELQSKYGHICNFTKPRTIEAKDTLALLCGGDSFDSGMIFDTLKAFVEWDEQECSYADSFLLDDDISEFKQKIMLLNSSLTDTKSNNRDLKGVSNKIDLGSVTPKYNLNLLEIILDKMKESLFIIKYRELLGLYGWGDEYLTDDMLKDLRNTLKKYNIDSKDEICMFLSQCSRECENGSKLLENGSPSYFEKQSYPYEWRGSGYIHLTHDYGYKAYAIYKILENYPEIQLSDPSLTYLNPKDWGREYINPRYDEILAKAEELGLDISFYTKIVDIGPEYVAENFAWDTAGYFWETKGCNDAYDSKCSIDDISKLINGDKCKTLKERQEEYELMLDSYEKAFGD